MTALRLVVGRANQKRAVELRAGSEGEITELFLRPCGDVIVLSPMDLKIINDLQGVGDAESDPDLSPAEPQG